MLLIKENRILTFRNEEFEVVYHHYKCEESGELFTTTELDEINLTQLYNQYRVYRTSERICKKNTSCSRWRDEITQRVAKILYFVRQINRNQKFFPYTVTDEFFMLQPSNYHCRMGVYLICILQNIRFGQYAFCH